MLALKSGFRLRKIYSKLIEETMRALQERRAPMPFPLSPRSSRRERSGGSETVVEPPIIPFFPFLILFPSGRSASARYAARKRIHRRDGDPPRSSRRASLMPFLHLFYFSSFSRSTFHRLIVEKTRGVEKKSPAARRVINVSGRAAPRSPPIPVSGFPRRLPPFVPRSNGPSHARRG